MQAKQDEPLDEVRAILQRLQRISTGKEDDPSADGVAKRVATSPAPAPGASAPALERPPKPPASARPARIAIIAVGVVALLAGIGFAVWPGGAPPPKPRDQDNPPATAAITVPLPTIAESEARPSSLPGSQPDAERLAEAQQLMETGKIVEARQLLLGDLAERRAEAALLLARSYDPKALPLTTGRNAPADADEAERWYRQWYKIAGQEGLTLDQDRLDRIIRAMR